MPEPISEEDWIQLSLALIGHEYGSVANFERDVAGAIQETAEVEFAEKLPRLIKQLKVRSGE